MVEKGIENLFTEDTLRKARDHKLAFIDHTPATTRTVRGQEIESPETWVINRDEKRNLCDWLCDNGNAADFARFEVVFSVLEECLT